MIRCGLELICCFGDDKSTYLFPAVDESAGKQADRVRLHLVDWLTLAIFRVRAGLFSIVFLVPSFVSSLRLAFTFRRQ